MPCVQCRYKANMDLAQPALFGKGAGCELLKEMCEAYIQKNPSQNYYCPADRKDSESHLVAPPAVLTHCQRGSCSILLYATAYYCHICVPKQHVQRAEWRKDCQVAYAILAVHVCPPCMQRLVSAGQTSQLLQACSPLRWTHQAG